MTTTIKKCWRWSLVFCSLLCLSVTVSAQTFRSAFDTNQAYRKLLHATVFNVGGEGWASYKTPEEKAFQTIFESPDSTRLFRRLINDANAEGLLYALFGLHLRDREAFEFEVARLEINGEYSERAEGKIALLKGKAHVTRGCLFSFVDIHAAVGQIANGDWDGLFLRNSRWPNLDPFWR